MLILEEFAMAVVAGGSAGLAAEHAATEIIDRIVSKTVEEDRRGIVADQPEVFLTKPPATREFPNALVS